MFLSVTPLTDVAVWARGKGLEIVLLVTGAILLTRLATWLGGKITDRIDANAQETDVLVRSEASKHRHALAQVITWATLVVIYIAAGVAIAARLGVPVTSLVALPPWRLSRWGSARSASSRTSWLASSSSLSVSTASGTSSGFGCRACPIPLSGPSRMSRCE